MRMSRHLALRGLRLGQLPRELRGQAFLLALQARDLGLPRLRSVPLLVVPVRETSGSSDITELLHVF